MDALYRALGAAGGLPFEPSAVFVAPRAKASLKYPTLAAANPEARESRTAIAVVAGRGRSRTSGRCAPTQRGRRASRGRRKLVVGAPVALARRAALVLALRPSSTATPPAAPPSAAAAVGAAPAAPRPRRRPPRATAGRRAVAAAPPETPRPRRRRRRRAVDAGQAEPLAPPAREPTRPKSRRPIRCTGQIPVPAEPTPGDSSRSRRIRSALLPRPAVRGFPVEVSPEAAAAHEAALVLDLHNDVLTKLTHMPGYDFSRAHAPGDVLQPAAPRSRPAAHPARRHRRARLPDVRRVSLRRVAATASGASSTARARWRRRTPTRSCWRARADDIRAARAAGKLALFLGVEGSYAIDDDMAGRRRAAGRGGRPVPRARCGSATAAPGRRAARRAARDSGLTEHGRALVRALQRRGHPARRLAREQEDVLGHARGSRHAAVLVALGRGRRAPAPAQPRRRSDPRARRARRHRRRHLRGGVSGRHCSARSSASPTTSNTSPASAARTAWRSARTSTAS